MMTHHDSPLFSDEQWQVLADRLQLPARQEQVIRQLLAGRSDKQIAHAIGVALPTVRSHLRRVYTKFDVQDRTELVLYVIREYLQLIGQPQNCSAINSHNISLT